MSETKRWLEHAVPFCHGTGVYDFAINGTRHLGRLAGRSGINAARLLHATVPGLLRLEAR